jgi:aminopeptidase N
VSVLLKFQATKIITLNQTLYFTIYILFHHYLLNTNEIFSSSRKYQSSTQNDLWEALTSQAHADSALDPNMSVKEIMDTWTLQTGFPVIMVTRDYTTGTVHLKQVSP